MTILDPILYADGALRLTDHGPRGGGLVLVHVPSGRQIDLKHTDADLANYRITNMIQLGWRDGPIFDMVAFYERTHYIDTLELSAPSKPPFVPFYHG